LLCCIEIALKPKGDMNMGVHNDTCGCPKCFHINYPHRANPHDDGGGVHNDTCGCPKCFDINYPGRANPHDGVTTYAGGSGMMSVNSVGSTAMGDDAVVFSLPQAMAVLQDFLADRSAPPTVDQGLAARNALQSVLSEGEIPASLKTELLALIEKVREKLQH
jgi:hypothetical protein